MARDKKTAVLGSGHNYILEYTGTLPAVAEIVGQCTAENRYGTTYNGATLTYTAETHEESDDLGYVTATIYTKEDVKLKLGVFSWSPDMLDKLVATCRIAKEGDYTVAKLGGLGNDNRKNYLVVFEHVDKRAGNLYVIIVGKNTNGLSLAFAKDNVTKLEPEFTASPQDDDGTLVMLVAGPPAAGQVQQSP